MCSQTCTQAKAKVSADRKKLTDELRGEKEGRCRAEDIIKRMSKELEACTAARLRLEEAFARVMGELRYKLAHIRISCMPHAAAMH